MARFICLFLLLTIPAIRSFAQRILNEQAFLDSLNTVLRQAASDSVQARASFSLAHFWSFKDSAQSRKYLEQAQRLGKKYPFLRTLYSYYEAYYYYPLNKERSESLFLKAATELGRYKTKEGYRFTAMAWQNYGIFRQMKDNEQEYLNILLNKVIPLAQQSGEIENIANAYRSVGLIFKNNAQNEKAAAYFEQAIKLLQQNSPANNDLLVYLYINASNNYILMKKNSVAKTMLDSIRSMLAPYPQSEFVMDYYFNEALYYDNIQQYDSAVSSYDKAIGLARKAKDTYKIQGLVIKKYKALNQLKQYGKAKQALLDVLAHENVTHTNNKILIYNGLAETYAKLGDMTQAYRWLERYANLQDSLNKAKLKEHLHELDMKYNKLQHEKKIAALQAQNEKAALSLKNNRLMNWLLGAASVFLLIVAAFSLLYYRNSKKLAAQQALNHRQQLKEIAQQQQIQFVQAMLQGEERERKRVAVDLHDGLGGMLAGVKMNLSRLATGGPVPDTSTELARIIGQLDSSVTELRHIARNMMPETLLRSGLETALRDLCESMMAAGPSIDFQAFDISRELPQPVQIAIYRIVQELLANAVRHARASEILVQCSQHDNVCFITVEDNGKCFDVQQAEAAGGMGLSNIRNRVNYLEGKMEIVSTLNEGTTVNIELHVAGKA